MGSTSNYAIYINNIKLELKNIQKRGHREEPSMYENIEKKYKLRI